MERRDSIFVALNSEALRATMERGMETHEASEPTGYRMS
jgi:hypothetical protein